MKKQAGKEFDLYETVTDRIVELLEAGTVPWKHFALRPLTDPRNAGSKRPYNGINYFLLNIVRVSRGYSCNEWLTWNQAAKLGGNVKALEAKNSEMVVFWKFLEKIDKETGEKKRIPMLRYFRVYNVDQCENLKLKIASITREGTDANAAAEALIAGMPNAPKIVISNVPQATYNTKTDVVQMLERSRCKSDGEYYSSLFHELVHATGHESRLNRKSSTKDKDEYALEELVAEMGSAMLCAATGIFQEVEENVAAYCAGWIKKLKNDKHLLVKAGGRARKAVEYILNVKADKVNEEGSSEPASEMEMVAAA